MFPKPLHDCRLYTFVDTAYLRNRKPTEVARQLCDGGADVIQFRAKNQAIDCVRKIAEDIAPIADAAQVHLVINDYPDIAAALPYPFCHLGQEDFFDEGFSLVSELTKRAPHSSSAPLLRVGLSTHSPSQARRAIDAQPDYIAIGPVFSTPTKPSARPVTLDYVRWAAEHVRIPWFAIGGITLANLDSVLQAGASRVCVVSAILDGDNVAQACAEFHRRLTSAAS